jgi:hypothetical protein
LGGILNEHSTPKKTNPFCSRSLSGGEEILTITMPKSKGKISDTAPFCNVVEESFANDENFVTEVIPLENLCGAVIELCEHKARCENSGVGVHRSPHVGALMKFFSMATWRPGELIGKQVEWEAETYKDVFIGIDLDFVSFTSGC